MTAAPAGALDALDLALAVGCSGMAALAWLALRSGGRAARLARAARADAAARRRERDGAREELAEAEAALEAARGVAREAMSRCAEAQGDVRRWMDLVAQRDRRIADLESRLERMGAAGAVGAAADELHAALNAIVSAEVTS